MCSCCAARDLGKLPREVGSLRGGDARLMHPRARCEQFWSAKQPFGAGGAGDRALPVDVNIA
jgi:hypothetical protein